MSEADHLRAQAVRCRRIAAETDDDPGLRDDLETLAEDYETRADIVASRDQFEGGLS
jgi:hypothetical protein